MANYLQTALTLGNGFAFGGPGALENRDQSTTGAARAGILAASTVFSGGNFSDIASTAASAASSGLGSYAGLASTALGMLGLGGIGMGTKPKALHTEFAKTSAEHVANKPYGSGNDLVFYLQRADQDAAGQSLQAESVAKAPAEDEAILAAMMQGTLDNDPAADFGDALLFAQANGSLDSAAFGPEVVIELDGSQFAPEPVLELD